MKNYLIPIFAAVSALALSNCADMGPNTQRGATTGAIAGGVIGGVLGHQSGRALEGAAAGAAVGGVGGAMYGNSQDYPRRTYYRY